MPALPDPHAGHPPADIEIDAALVRALLAEQHPDLAGETIEIVAFGWDNVMARVGPNLCARLPRRAVAALLMANEQKWLASLAPRLPLPVPAPLRLGVAGEKFPWPWSIVPWIEGAPADLDPPAPDQAGVLANFLRALHAPAPADAPTNPVRGVPLSTRQDAVEVRIDHLASISEPISASVRRAWEDGLAAPFDHPPVWLHGDMHPRNVLVKDGRLAAIIDWGDITHGDPATDLASVWMLLGDRAARERALTLYAPNQNLLRRAGGWAAFFAIVLRDAGLINNPPLAVAGARTLQRIADGP